MQPKAVATAFTSQFIAILFCSGALASAPSSEIPAKRLFPLSKTEKPCDDFHKYVCAKVESSFKLREDRSMHDFAFNDSAERLLEAKKKFFANINKEAHLTPRQQQLKDYYQACMDKKTGVAQEKQALQRLSSDLAKIKTPEEFAIYNIDNLKSGHESFYNFGGESNKDNPLVYDILILSSLMNLPEHTYYDNKELMTDYRNLIVNYLKIADPGLEQENYESRADAMMDLEKEFVAIYPHPEVRRQRWSEKRQEKQKDFEKKYPELHFEKVLDETPQGLFVNNPIPESLDFLNKKLADAKVEPKKLNVLKDFYLFSIGKNFLDDSDAKFFKQWFDFEKKYLGGPNVRPSRSERCTRSVMHSFTKELDELLLARIFPNFPEDKIKAVGEKIRQSILTGLQGNKWLSSDAKKKAMLKIEKAKLYLIKPQNDKEWDFIPVKKYSAKNRIDNQELLNQTQFEKDMSDLKDPVNLVAWGMGPLTVNAYYDSSANKFVLPIGILQYPFFVAEGDLTENLGAVGAVFGHEMGHGIDDQGAKYDENGKLDQWMSMNDLKEFTSRGQKMVVQFDKIGHKGALTLGENVADLVGLTFAYNAAFPDGKGSVQEKQKFFVAYARLWCYVARPKAEEKQLKTNPHSLGWARVNEQVKHQPGFIEAFQCKPGDKMFLPEDERVKIW